LSTATKLFIVLDVLAVLVIVTLLLVTSTIIARRMRVTADEALRHHITSLRTVLAWESYYLRAEARTVARLEGIDEALRTADAQRIGQLLMPLHVTHDLDAIYVVAPDGQVLATLGQEGPDPASVGTLDLVRQGFEGKNLSHPIVANGGLWLAGVAPHVGPKGIVDTAFLLTRRLDHDFLLGLSHNLGPHIVLTDGDLVVSSFFPDDQKDLLASGLLPGSVASGEQRLHDVRLDNGPYRLLVAPLSANGSPTLVVGLLQPTGLIEGAIRQTVGQIVVLGILLIGVTFALIHFLIRRVFWPLQSLMQAAEAMAAGDLSQPVWVRGTAEVEALAAAFDQMRTSLQAHIETQRRWGQELEAQVRARTRELEALVRVRDRLVVKLISAQEEERQRVARELHDETSQALANLVVTLGTMARLTPDIDTRQRLSQVKGRAVETLEDVKRIVLDLRPRLLDDYGLLPAIQWYVEERLGQAGVRATVEVQGSERRLPPPMETSLFRAVQEAVNNIARHAQASQARVRISWEPELLIIEVEDDGRGFDVQEAMSDTKSGRGLGLLGMKERVTLVEGTLTINSAPQAGTRIVIQVPLHSCRNNIPIVS
ncbi:MAG: ATP-binding protein, partial [Anaerolineae bacterium]